jgi:hypothetical protein
MRTAPDRIAVIAMQLARTDTRALSQAWYDALHRAGPEAAAATSAARRPAAAPSERPRAAIRQDDPARPSAPSRPMPQRSARPAPSRALARDADRSAQRVVRTIVSALQTPRQVAQTVSLGATRVRLLVRTDAGVTRVIALCAAADREKVARALAHVRVALAGAGVTLAA